MGIYEDDEDGVGGGYDIFNLDGANLRDRHALIDYLDLLSSNIDLAMPLTRWQWQYVTSSYININNNNFKNVFKSV